MKEIKKVAIIIIAILFFVLMLIYRNYNLEKLEERNQTQNNNTTSVECMDEYAPVCGKDGKTYSSRCIAENIYSVIVDGEGACEEDIIIPEVNENTEGITSETMTGETEEGNSEESIGGEVIISNDFYETPVTKEYYMNLRAQCGGNECCESSVDNMEAKSYKEAQDGGCPGGYIINTVKCEGSYTWCETNEIKGSSSGVIDEIDGKKVLNYFNSALSYGFAMPGNSYFQGYGAREGANHSVGINNSADDTGFADSLVKVFFFKSQILNELKDSAYGLYEDTQNKIIYIELDGNTVKIEYEEGGEQIAETIKKTVYLK